MKHLLTFFSFLILSLHLFASAADSFDWKKATVYFVITDRFCNGDSLNDVNYGRKTDYGSERMNAATFHGGDFKGMLAKAREGYFSRLGVDVVWMTDVYEQIHGWMSGSGAVNDFPHYGYHGYYPLDYTQTDKTTVPSKSCASLSTLSTVRAYASCSAPTSTTRAIRRCSTPCNMALPRRG